MKFSQTHFYVFKPVRPGFMMFTLNSDVLFEPEYDFLPPGLIAGLDDGDATRLRIYEDSELVILEIWTFTAEEGETLPNLVKGINRNALETAEAFAESVYEAGFCENKLTLNKGCAPRLTYKKN